MAQNSSLCVAYLNDVDIARGVVPQFAESSWFRRGWTLQELLAPGEIVFCDARLAYYLSIERTKSSDWGFRWNLIGHKGATRNKNYAYPFSDGPSLLEQLSRITGIVEMELREFDPQLTTASLAQRMH